MRAAIVENGIVTNIITIDDDYLGTGVKTGDLPIHLGDRFDGTDFYRSGEKVTEQTGLEEESDAITAEYIKAFEALDIEKEK